MKTNTTERGQVEPQAVIKPDPMGALNFAKEHGLPRRRSDQLLRELREGEA